MTAMTVPTTSCSELIINSSSNNNNRGSCYSTNTSRDYDNSNINSSQQILETQRRRKGELHLPSFSSRTSGSTTTTATTAVNITDSVIITPPGSPSDSTTPAADSPASSGVTERKKSSIKKTMKKKKSKTSFHLYAKPDNLTPKRCEKIVKYANKRLREHENDDAEKTQPTVLTHSQIKLGNFLGKGAFSSVYEIKSIDNDDEEGNNDYPFQSDNIVVKFLRTKLYDNHGLFAASCCDLVKEGNILAQLNHVNVIRLQAVSSLMGVDSYINGYHDSYFLVLERLEGTLSNKLDEWKLRHKEFYDSYNGTIRQVLMLQQQQQQSQQPQDDFYSSSDDSSDNSYCEDGESVIITDQQRVGSSNKQSSGITTSIGELLEERTDVAIQLAEAIKYLHKMNVVHRDLKPDNCGFDFLGNLKVFDFDIGRVAPKSKKDDENETFFMTQKVGSPRYMSPECAKNEPYNLKTDVYSYGLLFHQILTLEKPYDDIDDEDHDEFVFYNHVRPVIPDELPNRTKQILFRSWAPIIKFRPNMKQICRSLKEDRTEIIKAGTPPSLSTVVSKLESLELPKTTARQLVSPSMSYVSSCSFASFSDCNVVVKKKQQKISNKNKEKKANNNKIMNTLLNSVNNNNDNNKNKNSNKVNIGRSIIPSTIRQMFSGRNNKEVGVEPQQQQQLPPLDKKNLPQQNHSSGHFNPPIATRAANAKAA